MKKNEINIPLHDPFEALGLHPDGTSGGWVVRALLPWAERAWLLPEGADAVTLAQAGGHLFEARLSTHPGSYRLRASGAGGGEAEFEDAYRFGPVLDEADLYLFNEGTARRAYRFMGAHPREHEGVEGTSFAVWAPTAQQVSVVGDWNGWDHRVHPMRVRGASGVWELFVPGVGRGAHYKFSILPREGGRLLKADPFAFRHQAAPSTASLVWGLPRREWSDGQWLERRLATDPLKAPMNVYEVHLGSWRRKHDEESRSLSYLEHAGELVDYVAGQGFSHVELMPVMEHPFEGSWGYQITGFFAAAARWGTPEELQTLMESFHNAGVGVLLDWVPSHFPGDAHGLAEFDGTKLFEHADPRQGYQSDWGTLVFNYGRPEVRSFLISSAFYWLEHFHADGLRVDAVASMLYLDYSRNAGEWVPNKYGGNENLEAVEFLKQLNTVFHEEFPGATTVAEESTAWPGVSRPVHAGGLGFGLKWNMGWMHDTLSYFAKEPVYRKFHHEELTFPQVYAFNENFMLVLSHDEVVHLKGSLLAKMPGDPWQQFANMRLLLAYMIAQPGKKLIFMGAEFAQGREWDHDGELEWWLLERPQHRGVARLSRDMNELYNATPALWARDADPGGFEWVDFRDVEQSVVAFLRKGGPGDREVLAVFNMTPVVREGYRLGVRHPGRWTEAINTDAEIYGGSGVGNLGGVATENTPSHGREHSLMLTLPPLGALLLISP